MVRDTRVDDLMQACEEAETGVKAVPPAQALPKLGRVPDIPLPRVGQPVRADGATSDDESRKITRPETPRRKSDRLDTPIGEAKTLLGLNAMDLPLSLIHI